MRNIDRMFILTGAIFAVVGLSTGLWMVAVNDFSYSKVHAHINLLGWVTLALYGIVYKIYPAMKDSRLAPIHFFSAVAGAVFMNLGWLMFLENILNGTLTLVFIFRGGSSLAIAGVVLFFINLCLNGKDTGDAP